MKKLTARQQELLDAMLTKGVKCHYMRYMGRFNENPYYFRTDTHKHCTAPAERLLNLGLVKRMDKDAYGDHVLVAVHP